MPKINYRNTALAAHLAGNRGAGRHDAAIKRYIKQKNSADSEDGALLDEEPGEAILGLVRSRCSAGLGSSRLSDMRHIAGLNQLRSSLAELVASGQLRSYDIYSCKSCNRVIELEAGLEPPGSCCNKKELCKIAESFSV